MMAGQQSHPRLHRKLRCARGHDVPQSFVDCKPVSMSVRTCQADKHTSLTSHQESTVHAGAFPYGLCHRCMSVSLIGLASMYHNATLFSAQLCNTSMATGSSKARCRTANMDWKFRACSGFWQQHELRNMLRALLTTSPPLAHLAGATFTVTWIY